MSAGSSALSELTTLLIPPWMVNMPWPDSATRLARRSASSLRVVSIGCRPAID